MKRPNQWNNHRWIAQPFNYSSQYVSSECRENVMIRWKTLFTQISIENYNETKLCSRMKKKKPKRSIQRKEKSFIEENKKGKQKTLKKHIRNQARNRKKSQERWREKTYASESIRIDLERVGFVIPSLSLDRSLCFFVVFSTLE